MSSHSSLRQQHLKQRTIVVLLWQSHINVEKTGHLFYARAQSKIYGNPCLSSKSIHIDFKSIQLGVIFSHCGMHKKLS